MKRVAVITASMFCCATALPVSAFTRETPNYAHDIAPLLKNRCVRCHGPAVMKANLNLAVPAGVARGGENGAVIVSGMAADSLLWQRVANDEMPEDEPLSANEKEVLLRWIAAGARGLPRSVPDQPDGDEHWAFQPLPLTSPPDVRKTAKVRRSVDAFIEHQLETAGLTIGPEADRNTLIRRVAFDLTGLPPTLTEIVTFHSDCSDNAYENMVERYLESPRYGERWGKYWLDAAGYADSNGYFNADTDRPLAYRYRDYVVRSINSDKPWDQFVREQLAGDELAGYKPGTDITPTTIELLEASHYLRNSPDGTDSSDGNPDELRADKYAVLEGTMQIIGASLLGLTVQCGKCHDHKFEPFTQNDYYALQSIFYPAFNVEKWIKPKEREIVAASAAEIAAWEAVTKPIDEQITNRRQQFSDAEKTQPPEKHEELRAELEADITKLEAQKGPPLPRLAPVFDMSPDPPDVFVLDRGHYNSPKEKAEIAAPRALCNANSSALLVLPANESTTATGRRLAFARWLTQPDSRAAALLARVTVNRIWQRHFGTGIVATVDNLGYSGAAPTHPALLDFLASEFVRNGWSTKAIHRSILCSATYRQSSRPAHDVEQVDPDNRLLGRFPLRRLDAEAIRDGMLAISGELDSQMGGPYVPTLRGADGSVVVNESTAGAHRRSVYLQQRRSQVLDMLHVFDAPSIVFSCTSRSTTTVPLQSLSLLNSSFVRLRSKALASRVAAAGGNDIDERIRAAFLFVSGRPPTANELNSTRSFIAEQPTKYHDKPNAEELAWTDFCHTLLASNLFLYVE
jgi:hypothetical protein